MRIRREAAAFVLVAVTVLLMMAAGTARAAAPPNDLFTNATVISSLPFSQTLDTTQATVDSTDAQVEAACGVNYPESASVWYAYTPSSDQMVTVAFTGSSYGPSLGVVTGAPGSFSPVSCTPGGATFVALAGQTYYMEAVQLFASGGGSLHISVSGQPAPAFLDQSLTAPSNSTTVLYSCCDYVGQTFTAGRTGLLSGISIDVNEAGGSSPPLHVAIRTVNSSGLPSGTLLGDAVLASGNSSLNQVITFRQAIHVVAGTQYATVVNYSGAPPQRINSVWFGAGGDAYRRGAAVVSGDGVAWGILGPAGTDEHFQTYVKPAVPTSKDQCKNGGWQNYPQFKNQGQCVAFVVKQARQSCLTERMKIGLVAFRNKYGVGPHHVRALRRCINQATR